MRVLAVPRSIERSAENSPRKNFGIMDWFRVEPGSPRPTIRCVSVSHWAIRPGDPAPSRPGGGRLNIAARRASYHHFHVPIRYAGEFMSISHSEVERVARLARLRIDPADLDDRARDLARILELFDRLAAVDTQGVEPLSHPLAATQRLAPGRRDGRSGPDGAPARRLPRSRTACTWCRESSTPR